MELRHRQKEESTAKKTTENKHKEKEEKKTRNVFNIIRLTIYFAVFIVLPSYFVTTSPLFSFNFNRPFNAAVIK
jgi:hypothetical protein